MKTKEYYKWNVDTKQTKQVGVLPDINKLPKFTRGNTKTKFPTAIQSYSKENELAGSQLYSHARG